MEFIENAEGFYNGITFLKRALLDTRVEKDEKKEKEIISEMESYLFHLKQFLGTIMERKGNIVDLGEVWRKKEIKPEENSEIVVIAENGEWYNISYSYDDYDDSFGKGWSACVRLYDIVKWAYLKDLLPKEVNNE